MKNSNTLLATRLISSAASWRDLLVNAINGSSVMPITNDCMGAAMSCVELTVIELSLKAILARRGSGNQQLKSVGHSLLRAYKKVPDMIKENIENLCGYERKMVFSELKNIDTHHGLVNWRYLDFIKNINSPSTKTHFCNIFMKTFALSCCEIAEKECDIKHGELLNIANPPRKL